MNPYRKFDVVQEMILVVDNEGRLRYGNNAVSMLLEVSTERLAAGRKLSLLMNMSPDPIGTSGEKLTAISELSQATEVAFELSSGKTGWVQVSILPVEVDPPEQVTHWVVSMRDVTLERTLHEKYKIQLDAKESLIRDLQDARARLEEYSHGLEEKVAERTRRLTELNQLLSTILDSLGQGIVVFKDDGLCLPVYSAISQKMFGVVPVDKDIAEVFGLDQQETKAFQDWRKAAFDDVLDFEDLIPLAPSRLNSNQDRSIFLNYNQMREKDGQLLGIVAVATDRTDELAALKKAENERDAGRKIVKIARSRRAFYGFYQEARRRLVALSEPHEMTYEMIAHELHTVKGGAGSFALIALVEGCHEFERQLPILNKDRRDLNEKLKAAANKMIQELDEEMSSLTELLGAFVSEKDEKIGLPVRYLFEWAKELSAATDMRAVKAVAETINQICLTKPIGESIFHYQAFAKDLAVTLGKQIDSFEIEGGELLVPVEPLVSLFSTMVHAFSNAVYHGLEVPDERTANGKTPGGNMTVRFSQVAPADAEDPRKWISIEIQDDGRGVDPERVRAKLLKMGFNDLAAGTDAEVVQTIFRDQVSTAETVDTVAGKGVGLSALNAEAERLGGNVTIQTTVGRGTTLSIRIPMASSQLPVLAKAS
jgi:two-component system chemotaxis sensor kinase CheA